MTYNPLKHKIYMFFHQISEKKCHFTLFSSKKWIVKMRPKSPISTSVKVWRHHRPDMTSWPKFIYRKFGQKKLELNKTNFSSTSVQDFISICTIGLQSQIPIFGLSHPGILAVLVHLFLLICVMGLMKAWLRRLLASSDQSFPTLILESSSGTVL